VESTRHAPAPRGGAENTAAIAAASDGDTATLTLDPTATGIIIGTPAYMSPEQARGEPVGVQTDIWAFGVVLYEMLTGASPFRRKTTAETLARVLESQPDYSALPVGTPRLVRRVVERCVEKNPSRRMTDMGEVRILLEEALAKPDLDAAVPRAQNTTRRAVWIAAGVAAAALAAAVLWLSGLRLGNERPAAPIHVTVPFLERAATFPFGQRPLAISPDGSTIALAGIKRLEIRRFDQKDTIAIETGVASNPFFSPDGRGKRRRHPGKSSDSR
jgi:serine/threonine-protein kinase